MTSQEKKDELLKYRAAEKEAVRPEREIARWRSRSEKVTTMLSAVPSGGGDGRSLEDAVLDINALSEQLVDKLSETVRLRKAVGAAIEDVDDVKYRQVLRLKYVDGLSWEKVAEVMGISRQWATALHGRALEKMKITCL